MSTNLVGQTLGKYKLLEVIGRGSLAVVYKAYQPELERWVAVKVLHYKERQALIRFQREAQAIARLRHENIVIVYEYGQERDCPYIAMEYVEGGALAKQLTGEPMNWVNMTNLVISIADALGYAHGQGIIHRDVKPSNILMAQEDWPLLADFGLAKLADAAQTVTAAGMSIGTPAYLSPEQARGATVDHRADLYSLGVVMFEMITGRRPFVYSNPNKILLAHLKEPPPAPRKLNPHCPRSLEQVILTALQKSPDQRYGTMQEMVKALKDVLASSEQRPAFFTAPLSSSIKTQAKPLVISNKLKPARSRTAKPASSPAMSLAAGRTRIFLPESKITIPLPDQDHLIIGRTHRQTRVDVDLGPYGAAKAGVSRRHARLIRQDSGWFIEDLGSLNGTQVNNVKIDPGRPVQLKDGDAIRCSHLALIFLLPAEK